MKPWKPWIDGRMFENLIMNTTELTLLELSSCAKTKSYLSIFFK